MTKAAQKNCTISSKQENTWVVNIVVHLFYALAWRHIQAFCCQISLSEKNRKHQKWQKIIILFKDQLFSNNDLYIYIYGQIGAFRIYMQHINFQISRHLPFNTLFEHRFSFFIRIKSEISVCLDKHHKYWEQQQYQYGALSCVVHCYAIQGWLKSFQSGGGGNLIKRKVFNLQSSYWYQTEGFFISYLPNSSIFKKCALLCYLTEKIKYKVVKKYVFL